MYTYVCQHLTNTDSNLFASIGWKIVDLQKGSAWPGLGLAQAQLGLSAWLGPTCLNLAWPCVARPCLLVGCTA